MNVLGIETTCDETGASVVCDGRHILSNVVYSQREIHQKYGGVFPEIASRHQLKKVLPIIELSLQEANKTLEEIDLIAVAAGPGLIGSLLMGINAAKALAYALSKPLIAVNHVEAHLYSGILGKQEPPHFPALGVVLSGGHTFLARIQGMTQFELIGTTVDDAIGEAFDKVAKLLHLPYPGGPNIEKLAKEGNLHVYPFKGGVVKNKPYHFSFSGLKTNVLYQIHGQNKKENPLTNISEQEKADIAASFQYAACKDVIQKVEKACLDFGLQEVFFGGGVTNNSFLKSLIPDSIDAYFPPKGLSEDNGAMIAAYGYQLFLEKGPDSLDKVQAFPRFISKTSV